jgi:hypothetical protein
MGKRIPPVPPENRPPHPGADKIEPDEMEGTKKGSCVSSRRGQQDNIKQNTTNQGYQQDR